MDLNIYSSANLFRSARTNKITWLSSRLWHANEMTSIRDFCDMDGNFLVERLIRDQTKPFITYRQTLELRRIMKVGIKTRLRLNEMHNINKNIKKFSTSTKFRSFAFLYLNGLNYCT